VVVVAVVDVGCVVEVVHGDSSVVSLQVGPVLGRKIFVDVELLPYSEVHVA